MFDEARGVRDREDESEEPDARVELGGDEGIKFDRDDICE